MANALRRAFQIISLDFCKKQHIIYLDFFIFRRIICLDNFISLYLDAEIEDNICIAND